MKQFLVAVLILCCESLGHSALAWECEVILSAPQTIKLNQSVTLTAQGTPVGGSYSWSRHPNLLPSGNTATLIGYEPLYSEYIGVTATYRSPKGKSCKDTQWLWVCLCTAYISGPDKAEVGTPVTLTASAEPLGGTYEWTVNAGTGSISGTGNTVQFTGDQAGNVEIKVSYTPPEGGEPCTYYHLIQVGDQCSVAISSDSEVSLGGTVSLRAVAEPEGGTYQWLHIDGLLPHYSGAHIQTGSADFTPQTADEHEVTINYVTPGGEECADSQTITAYKVKSLTPRFACFDSGVTLQQTDFDCLTTPAGYESKISFLPGTVSTFYQTENVAVIGTCGAGNLDDAATTVLVVNKENKEGASIDFEIPNYVNDALGIIGIAEEVDLKLEGGFSRYMECCSGISTQKSTSGKVTLMLNLEDASFPIAGVPMPSKLKKYVKLELLTITILGNAKGSIKGNYQSCQEITKWSGSGDITATVEAGGEAKAIFPNKVIIIQGSFKGSTNIKENLTIDEPNLVLNGSWGGLTVKGVVHIEVLGGVKFKPKEVTKVLLKKYKVPEANISLPLLN